uniref:Acyl-coenzyme A thioesterase 13 n=1 Tax=Ditylenchus dipsaci TaxID=166011 RepID=A0A915EAZ8_9BILA
MPPKLGRAMKDDGQDKTPLPPLCCQLISTTSKPFIPFLEQRHQYVRVERGEHGQQNDQPSKSGIKIDIQTKDFTRVAANLRVTQASASSITVELVLGAEHVNGKGTLHGGMTAALVDIVTARAVGVTVKDVPMVSTDLSVSYMLPAQIGEVVSIEAVCLKIGRNLAFTEATFRRKSDNALIAKGKHNISFLHHLKKPAIDQF